MDLSRANLDFSDINRNKTDGNDSQYYGQWKNGLRSGDAVVNEKGQLYYCIFEEDKLISKTKY